MSEQHQSLRLPEIIVVYGSPGNGKTTVCNALRDELGIPLIELGHLRMFHMDRFWTNTSPAEEEMSFENLITIASNYLRHGYGTVLITDLLESHVQRIPRIFSSNRFVIVSLVCIDEELTSRVLNPTRDSGYRDVERTLAWNADVKARALLPHEIRLDTTGQTPIQTIHAVRRIISTYP